MVSVTKRPRVPWAVAPLQLMELVGVKKLGVGLEARARAAVVDSELDQQKIAGLHSVERVLPSRLQDRLSRAVERQVAVAAGALGRKRRVEPAVDAGARLRVVRDRDGALEERLELRAPPDGAGRSAIVGHRRVARHPDSDP